MSYINGSSPQAPADPNSPGTDPTIYTPVLLRHGRQVQANGANDQSPEAIQRILSEAFLNELNPANVTTFISRYLHIDAYPGGQVYPENPLGELESAMKAVSHSPSITSRFTLHDMPCYVHLMYPSLAS
jgi:hypothetical protein